MASRDFHWAAPFAAMVGFLLCLCLIGECAAEPSILADLKGVLGGPRGRASGEGGLPGSPHHRGSLHPTATQTCGNVSFACPTGYTAKSPSTVCNTTACTRDDCCTANPTCGSVSYTCPVTNLPLDSATVCALATCTDTDCCAGLTATSSSYLRMKLGIPCATLTQDQFKAQIQAATGVPASAITITSFTCTATGLDVTLATSGSTTALANNALNLISQAALAGAFGTPLLVTLTPLPAPVDTGATTTSTFYDPNLGATTAGLYPTYGTPLEGSSSNPALFALFTLLVLPLLLLPLLFLCRKKPVPPAPILCPCPCPCTPAMCCDPCPCPCSTSFQCMASPCGELAMGSPLCCPAPTPL